CKLPCSRSTDSSLIDNRLSISVLYASNSARGITIDSIRFNCSDCRSKCRYTSDAVISSDIHTPQNANAGTTFHHSSRRPPRATNRHAPIILYLLLDLRSDFPVFPPEEVVDISVAGPLPPPSPPPPSPSDPVSVAGQSITSSPITVTVELADCPAACT